MQFLHMQCNAKPVEFGGITMWKRAISEPRVAPTETAKTVSETSSNQALVGPSITITGGLAGEEDVVIQGKVEGTVQFRQHNVTIGEHGRVKADVFAKEVCVEGKLEGDIFGETLVAVKATGTVRGNITAPRVIMEDGARFKGSIDMEPEAVAEDSDSEHTKTLASIPPIAEKNSQTITAKLTGTNAKTVNETK
jgi:cytoskeletal protein CcmA (bactofilin family)